MSDNSERNHDRDRHVFWVMLALALALAIGFVVFCIAVFYDAINSEGPGLSENATQVLTGWGGGIVGILGGYAGYRAASKANQEARPLPMSDFPLHHEPRRHS